MDQKSKHRRKALLPGPPTQFARYEYGSTPFRQTCPYSSFELRSLKKLNGKNGKDEELIS